MCIDYNHLIGTLLEFISNSWESVKVVKGSNTVWRNYCCGEIEVIGCYIILNGREYTVEYNIFDCEVSLSTESGIVRYINDYSFDYQIKIYNAIYRQVMKRYFVESDYGIVALWAFDKTTIRKNYSSKIYNIVEVPNKKTKN